MDQWFTEKEIKIVLNHTKMLIFIYNIRISFITLIMTVSSPVKDQKLNTLWWWECEETDTLIPWWWEYKFSYGGWFGNTHQNF